MQLAAIVTSEKPKIVNISNKCFIHCPAEDKAEIIIYWSKLQDEHKLVYTGGIIDKTMMYEAVRQMGWHANFIWVK